MAETQESRSLARIEPQHLLHAAVEKGAPIETLERLLALAKDVRAEQAREAYFISMAQFQKNCPPIHKTDKARIQTRSGSSYSYSYAPLEEIMKAIVPVMTPLGLSVSYRMKQEENRVIAVARITHCLGHFEESGEVAMPVIVGNAGANPAQCVGIAATYARRYALLAITGIAPQDEDLDGEPRREYHSEGAVLEPDEPALDPQPPNDGLTQAQRAIRDRKKAEAKAAAKTADGKDNLLNDTELASIHHALMDSGWKAMEFVTALRKKFNVDTPALLRQSQLLAVLALIAGGE